MNKEIVKVGISIGDVNGIGMEVIMKTFADNRMTENITAIVYGSSKVTSYYKKTLGLHHFNFVKANDASVAKINKANLINLWEEDIKITMGDSTTTGGEYALKSLEAATEDLAAGKIDVLVTAPINKNNIQSENFNFPGHTEYLTKYANAEESLMLMVDGNLRVGVATNHIPIKEVANTLTKELILRKVELMHNALTKDFGIDNPKIAVLGLNPHAGDNGLLGDEEEDVIIPALEKLNDDGILAFGPYAADGLFGSENYLKFDGILAMYHDQGLVSFKALSGGNGVNFTAGLPIVRTSPDHGTAFDIVGKNKASEASFRKAIFTAVDIYKSRKEFKEFTKNKLEIQPRKHERKER